MRARVSWCLQEKNLILHLPEAGKQWLYQWHHSIALPHVALTQTGYLGQRVHVECTSEVKVQRYLLSFIPYKPAVTDDSWFIPVHVLAFATPVMQIPQLVLMSGESNYYQPKIQIDTVWLQWWRKYSNHLFGNSGITVMEKPLLKW